MGETRFDALTRSFAATPDRRRVLVGLASMFVAALGGGSRQGTPRAVSAQTGDLCSPWDTPCEWPETEQECCAPGYECTARKVCCAAGEQPCGGSPGKSACCCDPAEGERCNPVFDADPASGAECCIKTQLKITKLQLNDINNKRLQYLSAAEHPYFGGNTRVHGTITVVGDRTDELQEVVLEVLQDGAVVATGDLAAAARPKLLTTFGTKGKIAITKSRHLFDVPSTELAKIDGSANGWLTLRVRATSRDGGSKTQDFGAVEALVRYTNGNRYGERDESVGGDDWVKPSVKPVLEHFSDCRWGDISNMNGGAFPPHDGHRNGQEADGHFDEYNERNAATAETIIGQLNDPTYGSQITQVLVTYSTSPCDQFCKALKGVRLDDGRLASKVIRPRKKHDTHFHWYISP